MTARTSSTAISVDEIQFAVSSGVIQAADAERLVDWVQGQHAAVAADAPPEHPKGLNVVSVAYYFGAMLMISACAWFLGDKWQSLGHLGVLITCGVYGVVAVATGAWLRRKGFTVAGGLLVTVAVALAPLVTYTIEDMLGMWPLASPGAYAAFYPKIHGSWVVMELATIAAAAIALLFVRFGFLVAPMAFSFWFLSMDGAALLMGVNQLTWRQHEWVSVGVGLMTILVGFGLGRTLRQTDVPSDDFPFWCYLFGLLAFWGGLGSLVGTAGLPWIVYLFVNLGLIAVALTLRRATFLVFGAMGTWGYVSHLAYAVFKDSVSFPFALALFGLGMILSTVWVQRRWVTGRAQADSVAFSREEVA